jgi:S1-C subfamily serine protease
MSLFLSLFPTHFAVTARDSGLFVSAVQPGGPAEGKVCNAFGCCLAGSSSFPHTQIIPVVASLSTPPSQVQAADVIMEIDGRLTSGLTAAEGANMPCTPQAFYDFFVLSSFAAPLPMPQFF